MNLKRAEVFTGRGLAHFSAESANFADTRTSEKCACPRNDFSPRQAKLPTFAAAAIFAKCDPWYSINVTLDGCCDHRAVVPDEALHQIENVIRQSARV
jgi:hypothetical protein